MRTVLCAILLATLAACVSPDGGAPFVASVTIDDVGWAKTDGNVLVAAGEIAFAAELYAKGTDAPLVIPVLVEAGEGVAINRDRDERFMLEPGAPLPWWCGTLFRLGEAQALGITFQDPPTMD